MASGKRRLSSKQVFELLRKFESRNVTHLDPKGGWPIVWERAQGVHVWDAEGKRYLDLTAAFGVAAAGHANPRVVRAGQRQMSLLLHAMGDVHPHAVKAKLCRELSRITFERWSNGKLTGKTIFCNSGFEAVEAALKTAALATGKKGVLAFEGGYHGLGYGSLNVTHRNYFRSPFESQLKQFGHFLPFPEAKESLVTLESELAQIFNKEQIGAVLVEPIQARGGIRIPPAGLLPLLRRVCDKHGALLILDEIYTGFGRTGTWFACEHNKTIPDLICLGKALTGGFPLSACVGSSRLMDRAWPPSPGEALHTSTFLGHPVGCAMALAQISELGTSGGIDLVASSKTKGEFLLKQLSALPAPRNGRLRVRGKGLLVGLEITSTHGRPATTIALEIIKRMLHRGYILLPEGEHSNVIAFTPPLRITIGQLREAAACLGEVIQECT
jgi:4-aminobutyrate aminotransferase-like enzyme